MPFDTTAHPETTQTETAQTETETIESSTAATPAPEAAPAADAHEAATEPAAADPAERDLAKKEELLAQAQTVASAKDWRHGSADLRRIFDDWRRIPYRRTPREDELWAQLQAARKAFYDGRDAARKAVAERKSALVEEARKLADSSEWKVTGDRFRELMAAWKEAGSAGHDEDERLWAEFNGLQRAFFKRRSEHYHEMDQQHAENKKAKEALIAQARETVQVSQEWGAREWKAANARMRDLMGQWRKIGPARKDENDRLWDEFNGLRQRFFDAQHAHHEELEKQYDANAAAKQELIDTAQRIADEGDYSREQADAMRELDVRWKAIGYAGSERNDALWERFRTAKEGFWETRRQRNEERHQAWVEKSEAAAERRRQQVDNLEGQIERIQSRIDHATVTTSESQLNEMQGWIDEKRDRIRQLKAEIEDIEARLK